MGLELQVGEILLCATVSLESLLLFSIVKQTVSLKNLIVDVQIESAKLPVSSIRVGDRLPSFSLECSDSGAKVTENSLGYESNILLFISSQVRSLEGKELLPTLVAGLLAKIDGNLYVVLNGDSITAQSLRTTLVSYQFPAFRVRILIDKECSLSNQLGLQQEPCALLVDEKGIVKKFGLMVQDNDRNVAQTTLPADGLRRL